MPHSISKNLIRWFASLVLLSCGQAFAADLAPPVIFTIERFEVTGENPLDAGTTKSILNPFIGDYDSLDGLYGASDALQSELKKRGYTFHRVVLPPQDLTEGALTLEVVSFDLGEVQVAGSERYDEARVRAMLPPLGEGKAPNVPAISRALAVANDNPARRLALNFARNPDTADTLDAKIRLSEKRPYSVFAALNNIGTDETGNTRLTMGAQSSDLWKRDHIATATFAMSPDNADDVRQYAFNYRAPIYALSGWLSAFYIRSDIDVGNVQQFFDISGSGDFAGVNFKRWLYPVGRYRHSITVGVQDRRFDTAINNALTGVGLPTISTVVRSRPVAANYEGSYRFTKSTFTFSVEFIKNLTFGGNNRDLDYGRVRNGAEAAWTAFRFGSNYSHQLPYGLLGVAKIAGQYADEPLIPGEQFGLGGERTVRGYEERTISGDNALLFNFELWAPPIPKLLGLRFFTFVDLGYKELEQEQNPQIHSDTISSAGLGFRVNLHEQLYVSADYGHTIAKARGEASDKGNVKTHFNVVLQY